VTKASSALLVVDDDPDCCANLADILGDRGFEVRIAYDAPSAIDLAASWVPDLAILDLRLPGMDGLDLAQRLAAAHPRIRSILMTAFVTAENVRDAERRGICRILSKPVAVERLLQAIDEESGTANPP
jgi:DNA-binding NtrC family response regulator